MTRLTPPDATWLADTIARNGALFGSARMDAGGGDGKAGDAGDGKAGDGKQAEGFSQADVDRIVADRLKREQAKFSDYKDLKAKADALDALEAASKTEAEKAAERLAAIEQRAAAAERRAVRSEIVAEFKLEPDDAKALEHVESEDGMREIAQRLADKTTQVKKQGNYVPGEGRTPTAKPNDEREAVRSLFGSG